jgi:hypothetical protein
LSEFVVNRKLDACFFRRLLQVLDVTKKAAGVAEMVEFVAGASSHQRAEYPLINTKVFQQAGHAVKALTLIWRQN